MCGNNAGAAVDKCIYMQVFIKHSTHLNNERTVNLKWSSWIYKYILNISQNFLLQNWEEDSVGLNNGWLELINTLLQK